MPCWIVFSSQRSTRSKRREGEGCSRIRSESRTLNLFSSGTSFNFRRRHMWTHRQRGYQRQQSLGCWRVGGRWLNCCSSAFNSGLSVGPSPMARWAAGGGGDLWPLPFLFFFLLGWALSSSCSAFAVRMPFSLPLVGRLLALRFIALYPFILSYFIC